MNTKRKRLIIVTVIFAVVIFLIVITAITGDIEVRCGDSSFKIKATFWPDKEVEYSKIDSIACRDNFDKGTRTSGFGSPRLSMGLFRNNEFGYYTLYSYTDAEEYIVMEIDEKVLVIGLKNADETQEVYQSIQAKTAR